MAKRQRFFRDAIIGGTMIGASFGCGWLAFGKYHVNSRHVGFDFTQRYVIPTGHESIGLRPTAETAPFLVGDRIDILVLVDGIAEPLILDAIVTNKTTQNFGLLLPQGGRDRF